jgi:hypothetical protein
METVNFRVHYQINGIDYHTDFSMSGVITDETKSISAWSQIRKAHPSVSRDDVKNINIENLLVW